MTFKNKMFNKLRFIYHLSKFKLNFFEYKEFQYAPFDILKPLPLNSEKKLKIILNLFDKSSDLVLRLSDGSLLGLLRDGNLIKHDNDIDFDVLWSKNSVKIIENIAKDLEWSSMRKVSYKKRIQQLTYYDEERIIYDFIFWSLDDRFAINFSEPKYFRIMNKKFLTKMVKENINGFNYFVPKDKKEWLEFRYGRNWNIPQTKKGDWKKDCGDLGKAWWI